MREFQYGTNMAYIYIMEIFLNFIISEDMRKFFEVDVTHTRSSDLELAEWESERKINWEF